MFEKTIFVALKRNFFLKIYVALKRAFFLFTDKKSVYDELRLFETFEFRLGIGHPEQFVKFFLS